MLVRAMFLAIFYGLLCVSAAWAAGTKGDSKELALVEKRRFSIDNFNTFNGQSIAKVTVGWESYGELNADKSNAILITHFFSGNSHAAGKYDASDAKPGYWDAIIGPNKVIDTNRFFVLSVDTLANAGVHDPNVITTGPASINPLTNKPYGLDFPVVTIRDFVNVQKALLDSLGIVRLHAVIGASMGSFQALDWAVAYPERVARMVSVIGAGQMDAWSTLSLQHWTTPIMLDKAWQDGDYYAKKQQPIAGLTASLMMITQQALHPRFVNRQHPQHYPLEQAPLQDIRGEHKVVTWLRESAETRAKTMDANHVLYLTRASQLFLAGHGESLQDGLKKVSAKTLFLPASGDLLLMPYLAHDAYSSLRTQGNNTAYAEIGGDFGHLDGVYSISEQAARLRAFLD